jgi:sulfur carrier protein ThiS
MTETVSSGSTVTVQCRLVGELRRYLPGNDSGEGPMTVPASSSIDELLDRLAIPERQTLVIGLNGTKASHSEILSDGDELTIVAAMMGGVG